MFKRGPDQVIRRCVPENEQGEILRFCHERKCGGHYSGKKTMMKILQCGFYWTTLAKDAYEFCLKCDRCQRSGNIGNRDEMPLNSEHVIELFDV